MSETFTIKEIKNLLYEFRKHDNNRAADCIEQFQSKIQALEAENKRLKDDLITTNDVLFKNTNRCQQLQAELDKQRWIPAIKPPENLRDKPTDVAWKTHYYTLDYEDVIPRVMTAEQIFLNESSEVEYYMPIILPESEGKK